MGPIPGRDVPWFAQGNGDAVQVIEAAFRMLSCLSTCNQTSSGAETGIDGSSESDTCDANNETPHLQPCVELVLFLI